MVKTRYPIPPPPNRPGSKPQDDLDSLFRNKFNSGVWFGAKDDFEFPDVIGEPDLDVEAPPLMDTAFPSDFAELGTVTYRDMMMGKLSDRRISRREAHIAMVKRRKKALGLVTHAVMAIVTALIFGFGGYYGTRVFLNSQSQALAPVTSSDSGDTYKAGG